MVGCPAESSTGFFRGWRAVEILDAARTPVKSADLVFPMRSGKPISASRLLKALR